MQLAPQGSLDLIPGHVVVVGPGRSELAAVRDVVCAVYLPLAGEMGSHRLAVGRMPQGGEFQ